MAQYLLHAAPDVSSDQRESVEIVKLIRKLRWIGKDGEAEVMERQLMTLSPTKTACVLTDPLVTD
jgi:hypothetical protein